MRRQNWLLSAWGAPIIVSPLLSIAICSGLPAKLAGMHPAAMGTKSRESIYGASIRAAAERAAEARREADRLSSEIASSLSKGSKFSGISSICLQPNHVAKGTAHHDGARPAPPLLCPAHYPR
jgi:hypothetical protein